MGKTKQAIKSLQLRKAHIVFHFACFWYQDDIESLAGKILTNSPHVRIVESIQGADRENIRFVWHEKYYFTLNFDCYSQSCWVEGEDEISNQQLKDLMTALNVL